MMARARASLLLFSTLLGFWILLNGSVAGDVLWVGLLAALSITLMFRGGLAVASDFRLTPRALLTVPGFVAYFLKELVKSNLRLAAIVLSPELPLRPGIVKVRTRLKSPMGRLLLANAITLTPGTLTVELDGEWLHVHWVTMEDEDVGAATVAIVSGFEHYLEVMYG